MAITLYDLPTCPKVKLWRRDYLIPDFPESSPRGRILHASQVVEKGAMQLLLSFPIIRIEKESKYVRYWGETYLPI
jgi:hypothetical protein